MASHSDCLPTSGQLGVPDQLSQRKSTAEPHPNPPPKGVAKARPSFAVSIAQGPSEEWMPALPPSRIQRYLSCLRSGQLFVAKQVDHLRTETTGRGARSLRTRRGNFEKRRQIRIKIKIKK